MMARVIERIGRRPAPSRPLAFLSFAVGLLCAYTLIRSLPYPGPFEATGAQGHPLMSGPIDVRHAVDLAQRLLLAGAASLCIACGLRLWPLRALWVEIGFWVSEVWVLGSAAAFFLLLLVFHVGPIG